MSLLDQDFPEEISLRILKYLNYESLLKAQLVNQNGYRLGYEQKRKLLKKITFYECNNNNEINQIYIRISQLKNLLIEAEALRRKIFIANSPLNHETNFPVLYEESKYSQLMKFLSEEQKIENILKQGNWINNEYKILSHDPKTPLLNIMGIIYLSRKYKEKDEHIILQTPDLIKFLSYQDYNMVFKSNKAFDRTVVKILMQNTSLVLSISPSFLECLVEIKEKDEIFKEYVLPSQAIRNHLAHSNKLKDYMNRPNIKETITEEDETDEDLPSAEELEQHNFNTIRLNQPS